MRKLNTKGGFSILKIIFLVIIVVLVLSYFKISIRGVVESPEGQDNIDYIKDGSKSVWEKYFKDPATYLWRDIWINIFWKSFVSNMERIRDGEPTDFDNASPNADPTQ